MEAFLILKEMNNVEHRSSYAPVCLATCTQNKHYTAFYYHLFYKHKCYITFLATKKKSRSYLNTRIANQNASGKYVFPYELAICITDLILRAS